MALVMLLERAGYKPRLIQTRAKVTLDQVDDGFKITVIELHTTAEMSGMDASSFKQQAQAAKKGCPVSRALAGTRIELKTELNAAR